MRIEEIRRLAFERGAQTQQLSAATKELPLLSPASFRRSIRERVVDVLSPMGYPWRVRTCRRNFAEHVFPGLSSAVAGYRFREGWFRRRVKALLPTVADLRVLLPGSQFNCRECRDWLEARCRGIQLLDIVDWTDSFSRAESQLRDWYPTTDLHFTHGTLDNLPFEDCSFDVVESRAVLEHVGNMRQACAEMARVLRPGGYAIHSFGPLYYSHGGDHCVTAYGHDHGYDHLLLSEQEYRARITDEEVFDRFGKAASDARFWAINNIFSFLTPEDYLAIFDVHFEVVECAGMISPDAISYRQRHPDQWRMLLAAGVSEAALSVGGLSVILRKP